MQVQTEGTNAAVVRETELGVATPPTTGWRNLQPNSYGNFGPSFKKLPRSPISKKQQLQKGMLVDEDSAVPFQTDITKDVIDRFGEGIFRCVAKHGGNTGQSSYSPTAVTATGYTVPANGAIAARFLILARGFAIDDNNGLKLVGAGSTGIETKTAGLVVEAAPPANCEIEIAGYRGLTGDIKLDVDGNLTSTTVDFTTWNLHDYWWIFVGGGDATTRFATTAFHGAARIARHGVTAHKIVLDRRSWDVDAFSSLDLALHAANIDTVVEAEAVGPGGDAIRVRTVDDGVAAAKAQMDLATETTHVNTVIRAKVAGVGGNAISVDFIGDAVAAAGTLVEVGNNVTIHYKPTAVASTVADIETLIGTSTLIEVKTPGTGANILDASDAFAPEALDSGTDATAPSVTEVGSDVTIHFTGGASTVAQIEAAIDAQSTLIDVKTPGTGTNVAVHGADEFAFVNLAGGASGADDGVGKTIDVYFTRWYRNVAIDDPDYRRPSYAFEVAYPTLGDDGSPEYEVMLGNMVSQWTWTFALTTKAVVDAQFIGTRSLPITGTRLTGPSAALDPNTNLGVSTSTDLMRLRVSNADETGISTDFQSLKITVKNNVSPQKQIGELGATKMNTGDHEVMVEADVIFTSADVINAIRDNRDATLDILMRNGDFGALLDVQAMTIDSGDRKLEKNKSVIIASKATGFENSLTGSTESLSVFAFLPSPDA